MEPIEIAIIGAGPTGLMLANLLGKAGVAVALYERRTEPFSEPRAIAFDPETLRLFQSIDCYDLLRPTLKLDVPVAYYNAGGKTLAHITDCPPLFGHSGRGTYYQPELERALIESLTAHQSVKLLRGTEVVSLRSDESLVELELLQSDATTSTVKAKYAIDCSGGSSRLRRGLDIAFEGSTFKEKWLVIDVLGDDYPRDEIEFFCDPRRPVVTLPVSKNRRRWEFLVMPGDNEEELVKEKSARALMTGYDAGKAKEIERSLVYTFHARFAENFRRGRVLLAGDSAHVMPPFAGQGLNSGMRDAANLAWKLVRVIKGEMGDNILKSYDPERRKHVKDMTKLTIWLGKAIMPTSRIKAWFRDFFMLLFWRSPAYRRSVNRGDMIPKPSIKGSSLVNWAAKKPVGEMIVQPTIDAQSGSIPLDDFMGGGFWAIAVNANINECLSNADLELLQTFGAKTASISTREIGLLDGYDSKGELLGFTKKDEKVLVVRPDKFVIDVLAKKPSKTRLDWLKNAYHIVDNENA